VGRGNHHSSVKLSGAVHFSAKALGEIAAALPASSPPARVALLPAILRAWAEQDLRDHLSRAGRAAVRQREARLQDVSTHAKDLLNAVEALDEDGYFEMALRAQMQRESAELWNVNLEIADRRRGRAILWLQDLIKALDEPQPKPPPDMSTKHYLVMLDLAAIFQLVSDEPPTRRTHFDTGMPYGPFWDFAKVIWPAIYGTNRGLQSAMKIWDHEVSRQKKLASDKIAQAEKTLRRPLNKESDKPILATIIRCFWSYSPFVANLQFRHRSLWRKLRATRQ
jgi:hypothetical protein